MKIDIIPNPKKPKGIISKIGTRTKGIMKTTLPKIITEDNSHLGYTKTFSDLQFGHSNRITPI